MREEKVKQSQDDFDAPNRVRFNGIGEIIDIEKRRAESQIASSIKYYVRGRFHCRFCNCCKTAKPRDKRPANKSWICQDCRDKKTKTE